VMMGDRVQSDIKEAQALGIRSVLVKTGEFRVGDLEAGIEPDFVLDSIRELVGAIEHKQRLGRPLLASGSANRNARGCEVTSPSVAAQIRKRSRCCSAF
jgi:hypothetical protein